MSVTRDELLKCKPPTEELYIEQLSQSVRIRGLTVGARGKYWKLLGVKTDESGKATASNLDLSAMEDLLIIESVVDDAGNPLFTDADVELIHGLDPVVIDEIVAVAKRLSGLTEESVEDVAKKSEPTPSAITLSA